jgi:hypothetical protein
MTAVRLAAPDLARHLQFDRDTRWTGWTAPSLAQAVEAFVPLLAPGTGQGRPVEGCW